MTKSRTLRKAGAVVLSLAMAFSVAGVAPSADAAAKKPALSAKKGTITVGKTKAVKIQNTTKKKVKKLVVSSSNKKVATVTKKNKVKFIVTGKKAGTAKITAKVTLKKAVAKKKKYTLKYTATVKKAATPAPEVTATPGELKLESVESAGGDTMNVLIAYFSAAMSDIAPTDVQIRRKDTNVLYTVEKVVMASDKKSATMTLTNSNAAGVAADLLQTNVDYVMIITSGGKTLQKEFLIPETVSGQVVTAINPAKKQITLGYAGRNKLNTDDNTAVGALTVSEDSFDYEEALGRTITVTYDKTRTITKYTLNDETVIYSAFTSLDKDGKTDDATVSKIKDVASGSVYDLQAQAASMYETQFLDTKEGAKLNAKVGNTVAYAKVVLNPNGTVRSVVSVETLANTYVTKINDTTVFAGTNETSLKDYTIVKDGKTIKAADIKEGDVVFYNASKKYAVVYNNFKTAAIGAVYDNARFDFDGKTRDGATAHYVKSGAGLDLVTTDYLNTLKAAGKDITVYYDFAGGVIYVLGEQAAVTTTTETIVLTSTAKAYAEKMVQYITFSGFDGTESKSYTLDLSKITAIDNKGTATKSGDVYNGAKIAGFAGDQGVIVAAGTDTAVIYGYTDAKAITSGKAALNLSDFAKEGIIQLTKNTKGEVTGITVLAGTANPNVPASFAGNFKAGLKTLGTDELKSSTPLYIYGKDNVVKLMTYADFTQVVAKAKVTSYAKNGVVNYVVIDDSDGSLSASDDGSTTVEAVVTGTELSSGKVAKLDVITADGTKSYTKIDSQVTATPAKGDIVVVKVAKDGETVLAISGNVDVNGASASIGSGELLITSEANKSFTIGGTAYTFADTVTPLVVIYNGTSYTKSTAASAFEAIKNYGGYNVYGSLTINGATKVDTVVIENTSANDVAVRNAVESLKNTLLKIDTTGKILTLPAAPDGIDYNWESSTDTPTFTSAAKNAATVAFSTPTDVNDLVVTVSPKKGLTNVTGADAKVKFFAKVNAGGKIYLAGDKEALAKAAIEKIAASNNAYVTWNASKTDANETAYKTADALADAYIAAYDLSDGTGSTDFASKGYDEFAAYAIAVGNYDTAKAAIDLIDLSAGVTLTGTTSTITASADALKAAVVDAVKTEVNATTNGYTVACTAVPATINTTVNTGTNSCTVTISKAGYTKTFTVVATNPAS